jgi:lipid-binding SYLF domain-containing protein
MDIKIVLATTGLAIALATSTAAIAATQTQIDTRVNKTLQRFNTINPANNALLGQAAGALVFPRVAQGGVGVGGEFGEGVLQIDGKTVGYYRVEAASVGLTLGLARHSEIIMFMTQDSLNRFTSSDGWSIGADAGITLISDGASDSYDTQTRHPILGFAFAEKGLIGDLSFEGAKISKFNPRG